MEFPGYLTVAETTLNGKMVLEARDGFSSVKRWANGALNALGHSRGEVRVNIDACSRKKVTGELKSGWEKTEDLSRIRSAVSKATNLLDLLLDPGALPILHRYAWDGITLYWLQEEDTIVPWPYF